MLTIHEHLGLDTTHNTLLCPQRLTHQEAVAVAQPKTSQKTKATPFLGSKAFVLVSQTHCGCLAPCIV
jgi:hypothetical protein